MARLSEPDPYRLAVAAHELGHLIAWRHAGMRVVSVRVWDHGEQAQGYTRLDGRKIRTAAESHQYLVGMLAGREADLHWSQLHNMPFHEHTSSADLAVFRRLRKHSWTRHIPDSQFRADARRLVRAHWTEITRLAPKLARRGHLPL